MITRERIRAWLAETHGPQFELVRHFLSQMFALEQISSREHMQRTIAAALGLFGCLGFLLPRLYFGKYHYLSNLPTADLYLSAVRADRIFFIAVSMLTTGLVTVLQLQALFPGERDYLILKPLPVSLRQIFTAKFLSCFLVAVVVIVDTNLVISFVFPVVASGKWQHPGFGATYVLAHALATIGAGLFVFFVFTAMQGVLLNLLPPRVFERISVAVQAILLIALMVAAPYVLDLPNSHRTFAARPHWMWWFPPAWFLGIYETALGNRDIYFVRLAVMAAKASGIALAVSLAAYWVSYRRHARRVLEQGVINRRRARLGTATAAALFHSFFPDARERAVLSFSALTFRRSRYHKLIAAAFVAFAMMIAVNTAGAMMIAHLRSGRAWRSWEIQPLLALPLVITLLTISGLCYSFQIPTEVRANWVFRLSDGPQRKQLLNGVEHALLGAAIAATLLFTVPMIAIMFGWPVALAHAALLGALSLLFVELRLAEWRKLPFTCSYLPGRRNVFQTMGVCVLTFMAVPTFITGVESTLIGRPAFILVGAAMAAAAYWRARRSRRAQWGAFPLLFEDNPEPLINSLELEPD